MKPISEVTACVVDHGLFPHIAQCLAEQCAHVYYAGPSERVMPRLADAIVGDGFSNITRVDSLWEVKRKTDVFVFPDIGFGGEQQELIDQGYPVWGHHGADELEYDKGLFLMTLKGLGMAVPPHVVIRGLAALRDHLWEQEDKYVKVSRYRGDWETFHWRNRVLDFLALYAAAVRLGSAADDIAFYVFDAIDTPIEDGIDTWCIDGAWPKKILHAMERKDKSLIGAIQNMADVAPDVRGVNEAFSETLRSYGYRGPFSTEVRLAAFQTFFIDPTCRFGSPPSQLQTVLLKNLPEIIYRGALGEVVEPDAPDPIGAQVLITSDREKDEWLPFEMPAELRPYVKASFACEIEGIFTIAPNPLENWAGWLVATGDSIESVIDTLKERKAMLPDGFDCDLTSLCDLLRELEEANKSGITVTDQPIPEPATVIEDK